MGEKLKTMIIGLKKELKNKLKETGIKRIELAKLMGILPQEVSRIINENKPTKIETLERAFNVLGYELEINIIKKSLDDSKELL